MFLQRNDQYYQYYQYHRHHHDGEYVRLRRYVVVSVVHKMWVTTELVAIMTNHDDDDDVVVVLVLHHNNNNNDHHHHHLDYACRCHY